jgi:succinoglycan biosynthesis transport protein ExoP
VTSTQLITAPTPPSGVNGAWDRARPNLNFDGEPGGIPWARYLDAIRRNWMLMVAVVLVGSLVGRFAAKRVRPTYDAEATVWINSGAQASSPLKQPAFLSSGSWAELLRSFAIVDPVVRDLRLNFSFPQRGDSALFRTLSWQTDAKLGTYKLAVSRDDKSYTLSSLTGAVIERGAVGDSIGRKIGLIWNPEKHLLPAGKLTQFSISNPRSVSASLVRSVHASQAEDGQFLKITLSGENPQEIARTVNAWATELVNSSGTLKKRNLLEFKSMLRDQLAMAETELRASENRLENFRVQTITLPAGASPLAPAASQADPVVTTYFQQKVALDELRSEQASLERMLATAKQGQLNTQEFLQIPSILNNSPQLRSAIEELSLRQATLRTEQQYLTDANPRIKQLADAVRVLEQERIPQLMVAVLNSLKTQEPQLTGQLDARSEQLRAMPPRATEEMRLVRQVTAAGNLYSTLKARFDEVSVAEAEMAPDLSVLDTAVAPTWPASNEAPRLLLMSVVASFGAALALVLIIDRLDRRFRYPEQATHELGLSIAGTVPKFKSSRSRTVQVALLSQAVESFRTLRLAIRYDFPSDVPIVVGVSSPARGDGKSLVASNLGLAFASAGHRTLLIDGDVRCGSLHGTFDTPVTPGLVDFLHGHATVETIIRSTASENLWLIPRGTRRKRAPELLVSELMNGLVQSMRQRFDVVIIDSPPLVAGIDAYALGAAAGSMIIVLRPAVTDRKLAAVKLDILDRLPIRILGAVINAVPDGGAYRYYGADYSYKDQPVAEPIVDLATPKGLVVGG